VFSCTGVPAAYDESIGSYANALKYLGYDRSVHKLVDGEATYYIGRDGCKVNQLIFFQLHHPKVAMLLAFANLGKFGVILQ